MLKVRRRAGVIVAIWCAGAAGVQADPGRTPEETGPNTWPRDTGEYGPCENYRCGCGDACGCGAGCGCGSSTASMTVEELADFPSLNVTLRSRVSVQEFGAEFSDGNDCWGYVSPSGREYALMGLNSALAVVEITDAANPTILGDVDHPSSPWADVKTFGAYAYVVNEGGGGVQVIDLSDVDSGVIRLAGSTDLDGAADTSHNIVINEATGFAYLTGTNGFNGGLVALDLADPENPVFAGAYTDVYVHDAQVVVMKAGPFAGREIAFCYVGRDGFDIVDVTDKSNMQRLSRLAYDGLSYCHQGWYDADRELVYLNDELDEIDGLVGSTTTRVVDVSSLTSPQVVSTFTTGLDVIDHNLYLLDGFVFEANYRSGLRIFDATGTGLAPVEVGFFDTFVGADATEFDGAWSVFTGFPSGNVIVSDIQGGLFVLDPSFAFTGGAPIAVEVVEGPGEIVAPFGERFGARLTVVTGQTLDGAPMLVVDDGTSVRETELVLGDDGVFEGLFPPLACGEVVSYYLRAKTTSGVTVTEPASAPAASFSGLVAASVTASFTDDFETVQGWSVGASGDDAASGIWEIADPIGTGAQPEDDATGAGVLCFVTGNGATSLGGDDVDDGTTTLTSPRLDASGDGIAFVEYARWFSNDRGASPNEDTLLVQISADDGGTWTLLEETGENANAWVTRRWRVSDVVAATDALRLRFIARDLGAGSVVEAGVDDVRVFIVGCGSGCPSDLTGDGVTGAADLAVLLAQWGQAGSADLDGDGTVGSSDLAPLLAAWGACL